ALRSEPKAYMQKIVEQLNLRKHLGQDEARATLMQAGYRGQGPYVAFLFFRLIAPILMFAFAMLYIFVIVEFGWPVMVKIAAALAAAWLGLKVPPLVLKDLTKRRPIAVP